MALLDPILAGVVSSTEGMASAGLTLQGQRREADLDGEIRVAGLTTRVDFTQVTYSMPEAVLSVKDNRFRASNVPIFDPRGNEGRFDFDMSLQHLSNIAYDVRVAPAADDGARHRLRRTTTCSTARSSPRARPAFRATRGR